MSTYLSQVQWQLLLRFQYSSFFQVLPLPGKYQPCGVWAGQMLRPAMSFLLGREASCPEIAVCCKLPYDLGAGVLWIWS